MDKALDLFIEYRTIGGKFFGIALPWLEFFAFIFSILFLIGIFYCASRSNWLVYKVDEWIDVLGAGDLSKRRTLRGWRQIMDRLKSKEQNAWKLAIIEADKILGEVLKLSGFKGERIHERLDQVPPEVVHNIEELKRVHRLRDRIVHEPDFAITQAEASLVIREYEKAFRELKLID